jgi:redox-sensitive bicupin YhaK (pirin superfamily)
MFVREVARIDDPQFVSGQVAGHRARRLIDAPDAAFADPFVLMAEDWTPQGIFAFHPHRGIETVTFVIEGAIEHRDSAGYGGVIHAVFVSLSLAIPILQQRCETSGAK